MANWSPASIAFLDATSSWQIKLWRIHSESPNLPKFYLIKYSLVPSSKYFELHSHLVFPYWYKYKEKFVILQAIGIIYIKSQETRVVAYNCRYSSGPLIPNSVSHCYRLKYWINCPLEYLQVSATTFFWLFIYMIPIACKITNFSLYFLVYYTILWLINIIAHDTSKQRMVSMHLNG